MRLTSDLSSLGVPRHAFDVVNSIGCRPPKDDLKGMLTWCKKQGLPSPVECCRPRLNAELKRHTRVLAVGGLAAKTLLKIPKGILTVRGGPVTIDRAFLEAAGSFDVTEEVDPETGETIEALDTSDAPLSSGTGHEGYGDQVQVLPTVHPSFVLRANRWAPVFLNDLGRALRFFSGKLNWTDPAIYVKPTAEGLANWLRTATVDGRRPDYWTCDTETTMGDPLTVDLKCLAIGTSAESVVVPFYSVERDRQGQRYYDAAEEQRVRDVIRDFLIDPEYVKVGSNFPYFDRMVIEQHLGVTPKPALCSLLLHRMVNPEIPHGLGVVGSIYTDVVSWKSTHDGEAASSTSSDVELHTYCLFAGSRVVMADGTTFPIEEVIAHRMKGPVLSYNTTTKQIEPKRIVDWHRNQADGQAWLSIKARLPGKKSSRRRGIVCTPDHIVYTDRGRRRAENVEPGMKIAIVEPALTKEQLDAVHGTLLGDSHLAGHGRSSRFAACALSLHGTHAKASKLSAFKAAWLPFVKCSPAVANTHFEGYVSDDVVGYSSPAMAQLAALAVDHYDDQERRRLKRGVVEALGPIGFAWWLMDDGSCARTHNRARRPGNGEALRLHTQGFPREDIEEAAEVLCQRFGWVSVSKIGVLCISAAASRAICEWIAPYVPPIMRYKLVAGDWAKYGGLPKASAPSPTWIEVTRVDSYVPRSRTSSDRCQARTRYCLTVEDNHNFFTNNGLVANCATDAVVNHRVMPPILAEAAKRVDEVAVAFGIASTNDPASLRGLDTPCPGIPGWTLSQVDHFAQEMCVGLHKTGMFVDQAERASLIAVYEEKTAALLGEIRELADSVGASKHFDPDMVDEASFGATRSSGGLWGVAPLAGPGGGETDTDESEREVKRTVKLRGDLNPGSADQLRELLYEKWKLIPIDETDSGLPSTSSACLLEHIIDPTVAPELVRFLEKVRLYRRYRNKYLGTYLYPFAVMDEDGSGKREVKGRTKRGAETVKQVLAHCWPSDGRARGVWNAHVPNVRRVSNSRPGFQQHPQKMRSIFVPAPGNVYVDADYDQLHLRLIASRWQIKRLLRCFASGDDPHLLLGVDLFGARLTKSDGWVDVRTKPKKKTTALRIRDNCKTLRYAIAYWAMIETILATMLKAEDADGNLVNKGSTLREMTKLVGIFHQVEPEWQLAWETELAYYVKYGFLADPILGGRCDFADIVRGDFRAQEDKERSAIVNFPILAAEAGVARLGEIDILEAIPFSKRTDRAGWGTDLWGPGTGMVGQFHDSVLMECPVAAAEGVSAVLKRSMNRIVPGFEVPFTSVPAIRTRWE